MDFNTWAATKKPVTSATSKDFAYLFGFDTAGFEYAEGYIQLKEDCSYYAIFGNQEFESESLEDVEMWLFQKIE